MTKSISRKNRRRTKSTPKGVRKKKIARKPTASARVADGRLDLKVRIRWLKLIAAPVISALAGYGLIKLFE